MKFIRTLLAIFFFFLLITAPKPSTVASRLSIAQPQSEQQPLEGRNYVYYTVQRDDTLAGLERRFRISSYQTILDFNPELDADKLPAGKRIKIPLE